MTNQKEVQTLRISYNQALNANNYLLKLHPREEGKTLPRLQAGQFVQILPPSGRTLLRRPISVCHYIEETNELWLLIAAVGRGTRAITELSVGDSLDVILPLGNTFDTANSRRPLLVGGGVGIAPILALAHKFNKQGIKPDILLGGRSAEYILLLPEFEALGQVHITTNDGTLGIQGFVTNHPCIQTEDYDSIYTCGPRAMMKSVALLAEQRGINCEVSMENMMACGIGACLCCVEDIHEHGNVCVCTEGPVFNSKVIKW